MIYFQTLKIKNKILKKIIVEKYKIVWKWPWSLS